MRIGVFLLCLLAWVSSGLQAETKLTLTSPLDYQVIQRETRTTGRLKIKGTVEGPTGSLEVRLGKNGGGDWTKPTTTFKGTEFESEVEAPAGGWFRLEARLISNEKVLASATVGHVGVGEVFVVVGQSNSANHGAEKQSPMSGLVSTFDGKSWRVADDPQPGASGSGGSFIPPFGDLMAKRLGVPIGFVARGIGATSVREWLPKGSTFPNPPTIERLVTRRDDGTWESKGEAFDRFVATVKPLGPQGFRAVLWHQGESDANQRDTSRTLAGKLYREYMIKLINESRKQIGWDAPWFVAQVSYHVPGDESSPDIRAAQASLWKDGVAYEGPDSDSLKSEWRESGGKGVHFSGPGLREHAKLWAEKVGPWVESRVK